MRTADERERPAAEVRHDGVADRVVVARDVAFGDAIVGIEDALGVREPRTRRSAGRPDRLLADDAPGRLVEAEPLEGRVADLALVRPLGERDLGDDLGPHPVRAASDAARRRGERRCRDGEGREPGAQRARGHLREARSDLAGEDEASRVVMGADEERADARASALGIGEPTDHELLSPDALGLQPAAVAAGRIRQPAAFRHDTLEPETARRREECRAAADDVVREADDAAAWHEPGETRLAFLERQARHILAVQVQQVEDDVHEPSRRRGEGVLQRLEARAAVGEHDRDLAVEEDAAGCEAERGCAHLGETVRPVLAVAADQSNGGTVAEAADPISIVLDLVQPFVAGRRRADQPRQLRRVDGGQRRVAAHARAGAGRPAGGRSA